MASQNSLDSFESIRKKQVSIVERLMERKQISMMEGATLLCSIGPIEITNGGKLIMGDHHEHPVKQI